MVAVSLQRAAVEVDVLHRRLHDPRAVQARVQRDGDAARVEPAGRHLGQQGAVAQVVGRTDQHQVGHLRREQTLQRAGGEEAGESASHHHDGRTLHDRLPPPECRTASMPKERPDPPGF